MLAIGIFLSFPLTVSITLLSKDENVTYKLLNWEPGA
jgi:hypothetical protein